MPIVTETMTGAMELGRMCEVITRRREQLIFSAASMYSCLRTVRMEPRSRRTVIGMPPMDSARIVLPMPEPSAADMAMDSSMPGMACRISSRRMTTLSTQPPK